MFRTARRAAARSRLWLAVIVAIFVCTAVAQAGHQHDGSTGGAQPICEWCVGFDRIADAPRAPELPVPVLVDEPPKPIASHVCATRRPVPHPRPRGPPFA